MSQRENIPGLFLKYRDDRIVEKSRLYAKFTLPSLLRVSEDMLNQDDQEVTRDYQSVGALLVNSLAPKITELLFPSTRPFVSLSYNDPESELDSDEVAEVSGAMIKLQDAVAESLRENSSVSTLTTLIKHLIVYGNPVLYRDAKEDTHRIYPVDTASMRRDGRGKVIDCIIKERVAQIVLPDTVRSMYGHDNEDTTERYLYTRIRYTLNAAGVGGYTITQVVQDFPDYIIGSAYYPEGTCPYVFPVWQLREGDHYARGMIEDYSPEFARLSMVSESSALYMQEALKVLHLVQGGGAAVDDVMNAECGEAIPDPSSSGGGVRGYEVGDYQKVLQARDEVAAIVQRLSAAFMYSANVRDAERVTAAEIKQVAQEVERSLGGPYASLAKTLQIPLAKLHLSELNPAMLPALVQDVLQIKVIAGVDALGRSAKATQLLQALQETAAALEVVSMINQVVNSLDPSKVLETMFSANGVSIEDYSKSPEQVKQEADAERAAAMAATQMGGGEDPEAITNLLQR